MHGKLFRNVTNLQVLDLSFNEIETLDVSIFKRLSNLILLSLNDNRIKFVCLQYFNSVENLYLQNNQISDFLILTSDDVDDFGFINLANNSITGFSARNSNIKEISIENNKLEVVYLNENVIKFFAANNNITDFGFTDLINLEILNLSCNPIGQLIKTQSLAQMGNLTELSLKNTGLKNIQDETFSHQANMKTLDISYNNLGKIDLQKFKQMHDLEQLFIDGNELISINYKQIDVLFPNLTLIGLSNNKWDCFHLILLLKKMNYLNIDIHVDLNTVKSKAPLQGGISCNGNAEIEGEIELNPASKKNVSELKQQQLDQRLVIEANTMKIDDQKDNQNETLDELLEKLTKMKTRMTSDMESYSNSVKLNIVLLLIIFLAFIFFIFMFIKSGFCSKKVFSSNLPAILYTRQATDLVRQDDLKSEV